MRQRTFDDWQSKQVQLAAFKRWSSLSQASIKSRVQSTKLTILKAWRSALQEKQYFEAINAFGRKRQVSLLQCWRQQLSLRNWGMQVACETQPLLTKKVYFRRWRQCHKTMPDRAKKQVTFVTEPLVRLYYPSFVTEQASSTHQEAQRWINETPHSQRPNWPCSTAAAAAANPHSPPIPSKLRDTFVTTPGSIFNFEIPSQAIETLGTPKSSSKCPVNYFDSPVEQWFGGKRGEGGVGGGGSNASFNTTLNNFSHVLPQLTLSNADQDLTPLAKKDKRPLIHHQGDDTMV